VNAWWNIFSDFVASIPGDPLHQQSGVIALQERIPRRLQERDMAKPVGKLALGRTHAVASSMMRVAIGVTFVLTAVMTSGGSVRPHAVTPPSQMILQTSGQPNVKHDVKHSARPGTKAIMAVPLTSPPGPCDPSEDGTKKRGSNGLWFICNCKVNYRLPEPCVWIPLAEEGAGDLRLNPGNFILSAEAEIIMQGDGNLVVYDENGQARWSPRTDLKGGKYAVFQTDGNLVVRDFNGNQVWTTGLSGISAGMLAMQADGNLVIYPHAIWSTGTSH